jgi:pimeloyl-ACP methyl ester carboxylesterase
LPPSRSVAVRALDGTRLHAEVFGPDDGYPVVLAHGITCAIRVWAYQINDLASDYRVIAYDHRGHGRSGLPTRRTNYGLNFLAADLDAVLEATLKPGERAVIAGHSMGGIAISAWSERYPRRVAERADAVALINTTTGDALRHVQLAPVPARLSAARVRAAEVLLKNLGATPVPRGVDGPSMRLVSMLAVGRDADPVVADFVYELFAATPAAGRGGWARTLARSRQPQAHQPSEPDGADAGDRQREGSAAADGVVASEDGSPPRAVRRAVRRPLRDPRASRRGESAAALADRVGRRRAASDVVARRRSSDERRVA